MLSDGVTISNWSAPNSLSGQVRLVFPRQQHVADAALRKGDGRAARAGIQHRHVFVKPLHKIARLRLVMAVSFQRVGLGGEISPARAAGGFRIRRHDD